MSFLISLLIWAAFAIGLVCAAMGNRNYDIMLYQVNRRLPKDRKIKRPIFANIPYSEIIRLHSQLYPVSKVRAEQKHLIRAFTIAFVS